MCSVFDLEDKHQDHELQKVAAESRLDELGTVEFESKLALQSSTGRTIYGIGVVFKKALSFTSNDQTLLVGLSWKQLQPFQNVDSQGSSMGYGFIVHGSSSQLEFMVDTQQELEQWLNRLMQKSILLNIHDDYVEFEGYSNGAYGKILRAKCIDCGNLYAVKQISKTDLETCATTREALTNEIQTLRSVKHRGIVELNRVYEAADNVYLVTSFLAHGDLFDLIVREGKLQEARAAHLITNLLEAVAFLHANSIIHRDIKPDNILLTSNTDNTSAVLADFGLATNFAENPDALFLQCGSPGYIAPEIFCEPYGPKADVFSVGVVLFLMLSGVHPFGSHPKRLLKNNQRGKVAFNQRHWSGVNCDAIELVTQMLDPDQSTRISAADALNHPWIVQNRHTSTDAITQSVIQDDKSAELSITINRNLNRKLSQGLMQRLLRLERRQSYHDFHDQQVHPVDSQTDTTNYPGNVQVDDRKVSAVRSLLLKESI